MTRSDRDPRVLLGHAIQRYRRRAGMSQEGLAFACELHRTYIGSVERGERNISLKNIAQISQALGIKCWTLLRAAGL